MQTLRKYYAGIGSRETPADIITKQILFGEFAALNHIVLRSGGADGADIAFETGCDKAQGLKEIFIPWSGFNGSQSQLHPPPPAAFDLASQVHPAWKILKMAAKTLIARNMQQIMGDDLTKPVEFVICWTQDGCENRKQYSRNTGGTGTAIVCADMHGIPVYNLANRFAYQLAMDHIQQILNNVKDTTLQ